METRMRRSTDEAEQALKEMMLNEEDAKSRALIQVLETITQTLKANSEAVQIGNAMTLKVGAALEAHITHFKSYEAAAAEKENQQAGALKVLNRIVPWILGVCQVLVFSVVGWVGAEILRTRDQVTELTKTVDEHITKTTLVSASQAAEALEIKRTLQRHLDERGAP